ncbi:multi-sensor signal transduction histidine kinase [Calothrix parasitica NIES-267]|uniref:histidine kinase n=1 Tax=Calothrix parasitica NIES-267 TaxID=1973488 RepID=A0A1Z4LW73_9CYAN|nr:multi-sensor signal transduction histidine kinase [Calothrix parasitica NIES-267]
MQTAFSAFSLLSLENLIDYAPLTVGTDATIWDAITLMNQSKPVTQRVFVVENLRAVGLFSLENVLEVVKSEVDLKNSKITEVMKNLATKITDSSLQDKELVLKILANLEEPVLIENEKKQLLGYISPEKISSLLLEGYQFQIKQAEQGNNELQENLQFKSIALNAANNGIVVFDARLVSKPIIYANPEFKRICSENIFQGQGSKSKFIENIKHEINKLLQSYYYYPFKNGTIVLRNYCRDGKELWYQFSVSPIFDCENKISHYICIQTDITKHKYTEMSLLITQKKLQHLLSSSTGVVYSSDLLEDHNITFVSENIADMTGYRVEEILCDANFWISHIHPEDVQLFIAELPKLFTQDKVNIEYRFLHSDGYYIWIYEQSKLAKDDEDNPLEIIAYCINITERKQIEEDLKQALEKEKELNELKSRFISMTSHEFRTPLSTILSSSELLENYRHKWNEEKQIKHFNRINKAVKHMTNLLSDVLFFGKAEAGKLTCNPETFDLVEYSRQLIEDVQINHNKKQTDIADIFINFTTNKDTLKCNFDEKVLGHILNNLLSNAVKYSLPDTSVDFTLYSQQEKVVFEIKDEGIGIPSDDLPSLFDSFHRCKNVGNIPGTGLGLSIAKKCVDMLNGEIKVTSEIGVGTKFTIAIPLGNYCN